MLLFVVVVLALCFAVGCYCSVVCVAAHVMLCFSCCVLLSLLTACRCCSLLFVVAVCSCGVEVEWCCALVMLVVVV